MMQILELVLYGPEGQIRRLPFRQGGVSIITGASRTGKTAVIDILEYCLGRRERRIAQGVIREKVRWYGVRLQFADTQVFIARPEPGPEKRTSPDIHLQIVATIEPPPMDELHASTNPEGLVEYLTRAVGISPNLHEPGPGETRLPLQASFKHSLFLLFQRQDEIAKSTILFHRQDEPFIPQAIKDSLPYLLGAVGEDRLALQQQLRNLRTQARQIERDLKERNAVQGEGVILARSLIAEAEQVGLLPSANGIDGASPAALLATIVDRAAVVSLPVAGDAIGRLRNERNLLLARHGRVKAEIAALDDFVRDQDGFRTEATEQRARLQSIGVYPDDVDTQRCPLCEHDLDDPPPSAQILSESLALLTSKLESVSEVRPKLLERRNGLASELSDIQQSLHANRSALDAAVSRNDELAAGREAAIQQARVLGRVSLYLESAQPERIGESDPEAVLREIRNRIKDMEKELDEEDVKERIFSIGNYLSRHMTDWAERLRLEYADYPSRIDFKNLTVVADTEHGPIPMSQIGSGENWLGYHIIAHLALHQYLVRNKRPVPRFLVLDQPTQVYYPPDRDANGSLDVLGDGDREAVRRMFSLIFDVVEGLSPDFQVIILDHADVDDPRFQSAVVEKWRGGDALVPSDW